MKITNVTIKHDKKAERSEAWAATVVITDEGRDHFATAQHADPHHAVHAAISAVVKRLSEEIRMGVSYRVECSL